MSLSGSALGVATPGTLLALLRSQEAATRAELLERTGLSRPALSRQLDLLLGERLVVERPGRSTGGRPPSELAFDPSGGVVLAAWLGRTRSGLAVCDLAGRILRARGVESDLDDGPAAALDWAEAGFGELLVECDRGRDAVRGIGVGVPWPAGRPPSGAHRPPLSRGWDGIVLEQQLEDRFEVPAVVDRDANLAALAEHHEHWRHVAADIVYIKAGLRIACGIVSGGRLQRGAHGAAGEIGHVLVRAGGLEQCPCGNRGCLDTVASGASLAARLRAGTTSRDVVQLAADGDLEAVRMLRDAGRATGEAVAVAVNLLNPAIIVVGGHLSEADEFLAGLREAVYHGATAHATRALRIVRSRLGERAGLIGPAVAVLDHVLAPEAIDAALTAERVPAMT